MTEPDALGGRIGIARAAVVVLVVQAALTSVAFSASPGQWNVKEAGAAGDGATDDTAAFQRVLEEAGRAGGGVVHVPAGRFAIKGTLSVPTRVTLQGTYRVPPTRGRDNGKSPAGSMLLAYAGRGKETGDPFIRLAGENAVIAGLIVTYPEWKQSDVPPVPYPPCVLAKGHDNVGIQDCLFLNCYEAIHLLLAGRHLVRNVTGYPIKRGIYVDECYDIGRIENVHFWPFGVDYKHDDPYCKWINTQGVAFELARTDWEYVLNTFCFGYGVGYKFSETKAGSANGNFLGLGADSCRRAVLVEQAQPPGLLITNGEFVGRWGSTDSVCLEVAPTAAGKVSLVNCSFWGPIDRCVWMRGPRAQFVASTCHFVHWDNGGRDSAAIQLDAGKAIVQACTFDQVGPHVRIEEPVVSALLIGNQASGGFEADNKAGQRVQLAANELPPEWPVDARKHYVVRVGDEGDGPFIRRWDGRERRKVGDQAQLFRWSRSESILKLPVIPRQAYTLTLKLQVPGVAVSPDAGLYLDGKRLAPLEAGATTVTAEIPPSDAEWIVLSVRCAGWNPSRVIPGSKDNRTIGISLSEILMRSREADARVFQANDGRWR